MDGLGSMSLHELKAWSATCNTAIPCRRGKVYSTRYASDWLLSKKLLAVRPPKPSPPSTL
ncbi:uncharacterized protein SEPMUDRAFT_146084 [Sphaerulina musiva SO2202]|uniref:Uncharacterized protein n=1 Tax=Sphaerulina musiva (strain SO2202) TaxID=692275 RepID=N1QI92_SPHMS|nr:uncharacterized protein SEPMUDRAFT_146084 [Sphaerulina musiva SO2202]EMF16966.1 hypothetical protein SEPMUDRAFT_146084 [Sphaerulina musiva SO2202]